MRLNDIWRNVNSEIGFYTMETFDKVPSVPGVYAWFYPLRVTTKNPYEFLDEVNTILNYDAITQDKPIKNKSIVFVWDTINLNIEKTFTTPKLGNFLTVWRKAVENENLFNQLRRILMKASIFISPLYVGKTNNLNIRCFQHINGNDQENNFYKRYTEFAKKNDVFAKRVSDLLFVCIKTGDESSDSNIYDFEGLTEEIIKSISKPVYSIK